MIEVDTAGENHIVVIPGANGKVDREFIEEKWNLIINRDIFLFQLEIPLDAVLYAVKNLKGRKTHNTGSCACQELPDEIYKCIDYITPNETEIAVLTGTEIDEDGDLEKAGRKLVEKGVKHVVIKAGKRGAYLATRDDFIHVPGFGVQSVDTTAAGDSFNAGLAFALARGDDILESIRFANAVGAISTTAKGAQSAMLSLMEVESFINQQTVNE